MLISSSYLRPLVRYEPRVLSRRLRDVVSYNICFSHLEGCDLKQGQKNEHGLAQIFQVIVHSSIEDCENRCSFHAMYAHSGSAS